MPSALPHVFQPLREPPVFAATQPHPHGAAPARDGCCAPMPAAGDAGAALKRTKLAEMDPNVHCSIIGTCLTTGELRKLIPRHAPQLDRRHASDLQIHHTAVELSTQGGQVAKELHKAMDGRHALALRKFRAAGDEAALTLLWRDALAHGDVPGAYWALMTHPASTIALRTQAFGDVHMLSHLVGASNRADIRRLAALEDECARLREQAARQQGRLHAMTARHADTVARLEAQLHAQQLRLEQQTAALQEHRADEWAGLHAALASQEQELALHGARRHEAEQKWLARQQQHEALQLSQQQASQDAAAVRQELRALEQALAGSVDGASGNAPLPGLAGKSILYLGGRPHLTSVLGKLVAAAGGELLTHDGGLEDRRGLLAAMLPRAQLVVFPIDCISHNAMQVAKQACARLAIDCHPLRSASIASFIALMQKLATASDAVAA